MGQPPVPPIPTRDEFRHDEGYIERYANNVQIQSTQIDLKMVFGLTDQIQGAMPVRFAVNQHSAVSLGWIQVKLLIYFLQLHLNGHELENGKVRVSPKLFPPDIPENPPSPFDNELGRRIFESLRKQRAEFIARETAP